MALYGCDHCGFVRQGPEPSTNSTCPDCHRPMDAVTLEIARNLLRDRLTAQRFRRIAKRARPGYVGSEGRPT